LFLDAKEEAHDNIVRCAYDHVGGENRRRILPMQRETRCDWVSHSGTFCSFFVYGQLLAVVYKIYSKDSSCKRDEKCNKSVRKRYTETEK
jgi:hypothetical protein